MSNKVWEGRSVYASVKDQNGWVEVRERDAQSIQLIVYGKMITQTICMTRDEAEKLAEYIMNIARLQS